MKNYLLTETLNNKVNVASLLNEIKESDITIMVSSIQSNSSEISIAFKAEISQDEESILDSIIANHDGEKIEKEVIQKTVQVIAQGGKRKTDRGFQFTATAGQETSFTHTFDEDLFIKEGIMFTENNDFFDQVTAEFIDVNFSHAGSLYPSEPFLAGVTVPEGTPWSAVYPNGVPLHSYIKDFPVDPSGKTHSINEAITELSMKNIAIKMTYKSNGDTDVKVNVGIVAYS